MVRCFEDDNVIHVAGKVDPISDIEVIQTELCLADLATVEKALHRHTKTARSGDKDAIKLVALLEQCQAALNENTPVRALQFSKEELPLVKQFSLITAKPAMFVANVAEDGFENNPFLDRLPFSLGLGGRLGSGQQWMPWIALQDEVALIDFLLHHTECSGVFNACAPGRVRNAEFTQALAHALHRPAILPAPAWALRLALGEMSVLLLGGQRLQPRRALEAGFVFRYPELGAALAQLV